MLSTVFAHTVPVGFGQVLAVAIGAVAWTAAVLIYHRGWSAGTPRQRHRLVVFAIGSALLIAAVSPPLEHWAEDLVSVHMVQHVLLILVGVPLIALSRPGETLLRGLPIRARKTVGSWRRSVRLTPSTTERVARPVIVWLAYALAIWFWHGSAPYEAAVEYEAVHVLEHVVFIGAALAFWSIVLSANRAGISPGYRILMVFTTVFHSVLLGALLTFSDAIWYPSYVESTIAVGLDPLADQRLAGLLMWIPGGLVYTGAGLWLLARWLAGQSDDAGRRSISASVESGLTSPSPSDRV